MKINPRTGMFLYLALNFAVDQLNEKYKMIFENYTVRLRRVFPSAHTDNEKLDLLTYVDRCAKLVSIFISKKNNTVTGCPLVLEFLEFFLKNYSFSP